MLFGLARPPHSTPQLFLMSLFESLKQPWGIVPADGAYLQAHRFPDGQGFPASYQAFATQFGWGRLCAFWLIYVPLGSYPDSWLVQSPAIRQLMDAFYAEMDHDPLFREPDGYDGIEQSLLPFARSENGEFLAWDLAHRDAAGALPIYVLAPHLGGMRYGAQSLEHLVEECTDEVAVKTMLGAGYTALPAVFEPLPLVS